MQGKEENKTMKGLKKKNININIKRSTLPYLALKPFSVP